MRNRNRQAVGMVVALGLLASGSWGQAPAARPEPELSHFLHSLSPAKVSAVRVSRQKGEEKAHCQAACGGGARIELRSAGSCIAVDRNCSSGQRGYVEGGGSRQYCGEPCSPCSASTQCLTTGSVGCQGWSCVTHAGCAVQCDSTTYYCPFPTGSGAETCR